MSLAKNTRTRTKVHCFCDKCNGSLVDPRTKTKHASRTNIFNDYHQEAGPSNTRLSDAVETEIDDNEMEYEPLPAITDPLPEIMEPLSERNCLYLTRKLPIYESAKVSKVKKGKISELVLKNLLSDDSDDENSDDDERNSEDLEDDDDDEDSDSEDSEDDEVVNFASELIEDEEPELPPNLNSNDNYNWIILWILQYQQRYKLPNVAIDSLFKFLRLFLLTIDENKFSSFPSSLYMAKKALGIITKIIEYAACTKCHKLYNINEILSETEIPTCSFVNFPNHSIERFRRKCDNQLVKKIDSSNDNPIFRPIMKFPLINLRQQLSLFFCRKGFEISCRKWAERNNETEALFDIYDGRVWSEFADDNEELFFTKEHSDTHIGLMMNIDWFQPFLNSQYSVGVIYAVICNLPRCERFKPNNILTLGVIPGPNEPKLHEINNYLYLIVNQLISLWNGYNIITHESNDGRFVRGAIIACSSDVPATRKLCGFISARIACYRCHKSANFVNNQPNFGGFEDFSDWFTTRDIDVIREKAAEWKNCTTEESRKAHVSQNHVRWSEIYRLPYFNPVRFCVVDPMHCLFLGIAKWIVTKLWIGEGIINDGMLRTMQKRADMIKITSDLGRRPVRIATGDGFSNFTADMWKTFIMIFAIPITWDFLDEKDKKILAYFVRACKILLSRDLQKIELDEAFDRLLKMNKLIEQKYG